MRQTGEHDIDIRGARIHATVTGDGDTIVLIHAGIADSRMWDAQRERFTASHRVVTYDLRGFGQSSIPPVAFAHHEDLRALLDVLGIETATLVGASLGGDVALAFSVAYPARVDALVLVNTLAGMTSPSPELRAGWDAVETAMESGSLDDAVELELRMWVDGPHRSAGDVDADVRMLVGEMDRALLHRAAEQEAATETELEPPVRERLGGIAVPTLVVVGLLDLPDAVASAATLAAEIPDAQRFEIAEAAHLPSMERPEEFNPGVLAFIEHGAANQE